MLGSLLDGLASLKPFPDGPKYIQKNNFIWISDSCGGVPSHSELVLHRLAAFKTSKFFSAQILARIV